MYIFFYEFIVSSDTIKGTPLSTNVSKFCHLFTFIASFHVTIRAFHHFTYDIIHQPTQIAYTMSSKLHSRDEQPRPISFPAAAIFIIYHLLLCVE